MLGVSEETAGEGLISPKVWESCLRRESVLSADRQVPVDYWVSYLAQYYDINFSETCEINRGRRLYHQDRGKNPIIRNRIPGIESAYSQKI